MINKHLSDADIQQYVFQNESCDPDIINHIDTCTACKMKAAEYNLLFLQVQQHEKPAFDFDLADLVINQIPKNQFKPSYERPLYYFIIFIAVVLGSIIFYLFGESLLILFQGITTILAGLIITTVTSLLVFLCIDMYRKYQRQMSALNYY